MSTVIAPPELMEAAATDLATIGSTVNAAHMTAAPPTLSVLPAAADEVSTGIGHLFSGYAQDYQKLAGKAAASHDHFVQHLTASAGAYASAEAANVTSLLQPLTAIAAPVAGAATAAQNMSYDLVTNIQFAIEVAILVPIILITVPLWLPFVLATGLAFLLPGAIYALYYLTMPPGIHLEPL